MNRLLKFEIRKLFHHTSFYVCGVITILLSILGVYTISIQDDIFEMMVGVDGLRTSTYCGCDLMVAASEQMNYTLLLPIMIALFFCTDFTDGTIKNIIGRGYNRTKVFFGKLIVSALAALIYYAVSLTVCTTYASILWGFGTLEPINIFQVLTQAVGIIAFSTMCSLLSVIFRKVAGALTLGIFAPVIVSSITMAIDLLSREKDSTFRISPYLLTSKISEAATIGASSSTVTTSIIICLIYGAVFTLLGYLIFRKCEV